MKTQSNNLAMALAVVSACGGESAGQGSLTVLLEAEETIRGGLAPGAEPEDVKDGWAVTFDNYLVTVGGIDMRFATEPGVASRAPAFFVVDLARAAATGLSLWNFSSMRAGRWDLRYQIGSAAADAQKHADAAQADFEAMVAAGATYLIRGTIARADGVSCPPATLAMPAATAAGSKVNAAGVPCYPNPAVHFDLVVSAPTTFGPCEIDDVPGFSVPAGGAQTVAITIHGDHLFFNGFPESDEGSTMRLVQWLADCDLNLDGTVTRAELEAIPPAALSELDARFQLGGAPIRPLNTMWQYVTAQLKTQGHFQGEGECAVDEAAQ